MNSGFFERLGIYFETNRQQAADQVESILRARGSLKPPIAPFNAHTREAFNRVWNALQTDQVLRKIYSTRDYQERVRSSIENADQDDFYKIWESIANLFKFEGRANAIMIKELVSKIHDESKGIVVIDLSETNVPEDILWTDITKLIVIGEFLNRITQEAEAIFKRNEKLNSLVIIDEAHRLAPREKTENEDLERVKKLLIDAVRTTRKFGLGWLFISQPYRA